MVVVGLSVGWWLSWRVWDQDRNDHAIENYRLELKNDKLQEEIFMAQDRAERLEEKP